MSVTVTVNGLVASQRDGKTVTQKEEDNTKKRSQHSKLYNVHGVFPQPSVFTLGTILWVFL
jgi:hypothetical protein